MDNKTTRNGINASARSTYEWYLNSLEWLNLSLTMKQCDKLKKHLDGIREVLAEVPELNEVGKEQ